MNNLKIALLLVVCSASHSVYSQSITMEALPGHSAFYYQHYINGQVDESTKIGMVNISSLTIRYDRNLEEELMSQLYLTRPVLPGLDIGMGMLYLTGPGVKPSAMWQYFKMKKNFSYVIFNRVDIWKNPSVELVTIFEYKPEISNKTKLYSRLQLQTIWDKNSHLKSAQQVRLGLEMNRLQFGLAVNLDQYGENFTAYQNYGIFLRKEINSSSDK